MATLEGVESILAKLAQQETISVGGFPHQVKSIAAASDGKLLKAHLILMGNSSTKQLISVDITAQAYDLLEDSCSII